MRTPDFENNILKVLKKEKPSAPTLFEFFISDEAEELLSGRKIDASKPFDTIRRRVEAYRNGGYDFVPLIAGGFAFTRTPHTQGKASHSLNEGGLICDRASFDAYKWNDPQDYTYDVLEQMARELPDGMKFMVYSSDGVLENVIGIVGYETLCYMLSDDRELVQEIFKNVGERLIRYHRICAEFPSVGFLFSNDDWGFKNGTMLSHSDMKEFVYPYHKKIVETGHAKNLPVAMHSCGKFDGIYEDLYNVIGFDAKHSNEDTILPVEEAYRRYGGRIAILGGIDIDFLCRSSSKEITKRSQNMLETAAEKGGYALGSGNSIPSYVPLKNYIAMIKAANPSFKLPK